jgi:hypothetical protein
MGLLGGQHGCWEEGSVIAVIAAKVSRKTRGFPSRYLCNKFMIQST